jgi:hypothetical protein
MANKIEVTIKYEGEDGEMHEMQYKPNEFHYTTALVRGGEHVVGFFMVMPRHEHHPFEDHLPDKKDWLRQHGIELLKGGG